MGEGHEVKNVKTGATFRHFWNILRFGGLIPGESNVNGTAFTIYQCSSRRTLLRGSQMGALAAETNANSIVVVPYYKVPVRLGRSRDRSFVEAAVLPGFIFVDSRVEDRLYKAMDHRLRAEVSRMRDPMNPAVWATCSGSEVDRLWEWAAQEDVRTRKPANGAPGRVWRPGDTAKVMLGPLSGWQVTISEGANPLNEVRAYTATGTALTISALLLDQTPVS